MGYALKDGTQKTGAVENAKSAKLEKSTCHHPYRAPPVSAGDMAPPKKMNAEHALRDSTRTLKGKVVAFYARMET